MRQPKQYLIEAQVNGYRMSILFLTTATTGREAREKTRRHLDAHIYLDGDGDRQELTVKNRYRVATERDLRMFKDYPESILA